MPGKGYSLVKMANLCNVSIPVLRGELKCHGLHHGFVNFSEEELDTICWEYKVGKPTSGYHYILGMLRSKQVKIQRTRILKSLQHVDALGLVVQQHGAIDRQPYTMPFANYLWHMDGHHKLIHWGIVIHGVVDGFCRTVSLFFPLILY